MFADCDKVQCILFMHMKEQIIIYATYEFKEDLISNTDIDFITLCIFAIKGKLNGNIFKLLLRICICLVYLGVFA